MVVYLTFYNSPKHPNKVKSNNSEKQNYCKMPRYPHKLKQESIRGECRCLDVNISSRSWKPEAQIEIPNCIRVHCSSFPVCVPNPVSAMFHYLNYYHLTQRWTQPRTPPDSHRWVEREGERMEEVEVEEGRKDCKGESYMIQRMKDGRGEKENKTR